MKLSASTILSKKIALVAAVIAVGITAAVATFASNTDIRVRGGEKVHFSFDGHAYSAYCAKKGISDARQANFDKREQNFVIAPGKTKSILGGDNDSININCSKSKTKVKANSKPRQIKARTHKSKPVWGPVIVSVPVG